MTTAACAGVPGNLWDSSLPGESDKDRDVRHARALAFCAVCPVIDWCRETVDPRLDDGVRGGAVLPHIEDKNRRSPYGTESATTAWFRSLGDKRHRHLRGAA